MKEPNIRIRVNSPVLTIDVVLPEEKALKYLKTLYKTVKEGLKVETAIVEENED